MKVILALLLVCAVASAQFNRFFSSGQNRFGRLSSGGVNVDDVLDGHEYHYSWRHNRGRWIHSQAVGYCRGLGPGWDAVSINTQRENSLLVNALASDNFDYCWTSGRFDGRGWTWGDGSPVNIDSAWGRTGGLGRRQPDNREGNEACLGILNKVYPGDGITWHDIGCSHPKPVACERG